jgi:hypothetical protein
MLSPLPSRPGGVMAEVAAAWASASLRACASGNMPGESGMRERREHQLTLLKDIFFCRIDEKKIINFNFFVFTCPVFLGVKPKITWRVCCAASSFTILVIELVLSQKISKQSNA